MENPSCLQRNNPDHNILALYNVSLQVQSPQVKGTLITSITSLVYELSHELPNDLMRRILRNQGILENPQNWLGTQPPVRFPLIKLWKWQSKNTQNQISDFPCPAQFYWISLTCPKYFLRDRFNGPPKSLTHTKNMKYSRTDCCGNAIATILILLKNWQLSKLPKFFILIQLPR